MSCRVPRLEELALAAWVRPPRIPRGSRTYVMHEIGMRFPGPEELVEYMMDLADTVHACDLCGMTEAGTTLQPAKWRYDPAVACWIWVCYRHYIRFATF